MYFYLCTDINSIRRNRSISSLNYSAILDVYSISDILELNDLTEEDLLIYLVENDYVTLPAIRPIDFED